MKKCILCHKSLKFLKQVNNVNILECIHCNLAITDFDFSTSKKAYEENLYNFKEYKKRILPQERKFKEIINTFQEYVQKGNVLEVGSGFGLFASILSKKNKYTINLIEPELPLKLIEKSTPEIKIHKVNYQKFLKNNTKKFNAAFFLDSLEHFEDPISIVKETRKILEKNGMVIINLPNYKSFMAQLCTKWSWWMVEDHKYHFSPKSLRRFLTTNGYTVIHLQTSENFADFIKNLQGNFEFIKYPFIRKAIKLFFFLFFIPVYLLFRKRLWSKGYGGLVFVIAKKTS